MIDMFPPPKLVTPRERPALAVPAAPAIIKSMAEWRALSRERKPILAMPLMGTFAAGSRRGFAGAGAAPGVGNDTFTKALLHFDGSNGSTTITDNNAGGSAHTWTNHTGSISTAQSKFGGASYDCTGGGWVDTPDSTDWTFGTNDFTIDCWFYRSGGDGVRRHLCGQCNSGVSDYTFTMRLGTGNNLLTQFSTNGSTTTHEIDGTTTITSTGWHHAAVVRTGNTLKLFLDGVQEGGDLSFNVTPFNSSSKFSVGALGEFTSENWNGYIDEFRFSLGIARWTSNFTPPTAAYG